MTLRSRRDLPPVASLSDAGARWRALLGNDDPTGRQLWVQVLDGDGLQLPSLIAVEHLPVDPDAQFVGNLLEMLHGLLARHTAGLGAVAFGLARARPLEVHAADLAWAVDLMSEGRRQGVTVLAVHLIVKGTVEPLA